MTATPAPADVIADFLAHSAPGKVDEAARSLVAEDATYISLNFDRWLVYLFSTTMARRSPRSYRPGSDGGSHG